MHVLNFDGLINARDISNEYVKENRLLRSEALTNLTKKDIQKFKNELNLKVVIDIRTPKEIKEGKDVIIPGVKYISLPISSTKELGMTRENSFIKDLKESTFLPDFYELYRKMFYKDKEDFWHKFFDLLTCDYGGAVLWHCSAGKDRCGVVSAIIEYCLGYTKEEILDDYLYTNNNPVFPFRYKIVYLFMPKKLKPQFKDLFVANEEFLNSSFSYINETYGNLDNFIEFGCGMDKEKLEKFKKIYMK